MAEKSLKRDAGQHEDYGNTLEEDARCLVDHWRVDHNGSPGNEARPYDCERCRLMAGRVGSLYMLPSGKKGMQVAVTYLEVVAEVTARLINEHPAA